MSRKPSPEKVSRLRRLIKSRSAVLGHIAEAEKIAAKLPELNDSLRDLTRDILKEIEEMDCKANGNMGWENRVVWMLTELVTQDGSIKS